MTTSNPSPSVTELPNILADPAVQALLREEAAPQAKVMQWIAKLKLLQVVPFDNLVADPRLLPKESMRFFYIDPSWVNALIDGALSLGNHSSLEILFTDVMQTVSRNAGSQIPQISQDVEKILIPYAGEQGKLKGGFLLRSTVVSTWKNLLVEATYADPQPASTAPIRFEHLGADILLCIFPKVPQSIALKQPMHQLVFGFEPGYEVALRSVGGGTALPAGTQVDQATISNPFRDGGKNVVDIEAMAQQLQQALQNNGGLTSPISPADFALQLFKAPEKVSISNT